MTAEELRETVHSAFYRVVRNARPVSISVFFQATIESTMPTGPSPSGWPGFWWESIAVEIQNALLARRNYITGLDAGWLQAHKTKLWEELVTYANSGNISPV